MPDLNILSKDAFDEHEGKQVGNKKYISANTPEKNYESKGKAKNQSTLSEDEYMQKYNKRHPGMSAQEINNHYESNVIGENSFKKFNDLAGLNQVVTYEENGIVNRETQTNVTNDGGSSTDIIPKKEYTYSVTGGKSKTGEGNKKSSGSGKKRLFKRIKEKFNNEKVESKTGKYCTNSNEHGCDMDVSKLQGASDKADDKAYNKAQKDRSYRVKKDGTQVLKKEFAPGQWFSEKMETHRINKSKSQAQSSRKKQQRQINRERNKRNRVNSREHQHNNPQNYNKVSNFFNELSYKKDKPKGSRTIEASF